MKYFINLVFIIFVIIKNNESTVYCPSEIRCMDETRLNCNDSSLSPSDFRCCDGLQCVPALIPATDTQDQFNTTICVASSANKSKIKIATNVVRSKIPPIMASSWSAATTYYNMSNGDTGWGYFWYDASHQAIRTDFYPVCPFLQLYELGIDSNYVPCSVLFYQGQNYYVYPSHRVCCNYTFPAWQPDWLCQSNATFNGTLSIDGQKADFWMIEWVCRFCASMVYFFKYFFSFRISLEKDQYATSEICILVLIRIFQYAFKKI